MTYSVVAKAFFYSPIEVYGAFENRIDAQSLADFYKGSYLVEVVELTDPTLKRYTVEWSEVVTYQNGVMATDEKAAKAAWDEGAFIFPESEVVVGHTNQKSFKIVSE